MKKLLLLFLLLPLMAFSQFTITDTSDNWQEVGKAYQAIKLFQKTDKTKAKIQYRDLTQTASLDFYEFEFSTEPDTLDKIYQLCYDNLTSKKLGSQTLTFPEGNMKVVVGKELGSIYLNFEFEKANDQLDKGDGKIRYTMGMNTKLLNKLFGKK